MGRVNSSNRNPQNGRRSPNREERYNRASKAFSMFRPVEPDSADQIYSFLRPMQQEDDIPRHVKLFSHDLHASIIQERRMRNGLLKGLAAGFMISTALGHIEGGLPGRGQGRIKAQFTGVDIHGRNNNIISGRIKDQEGLISQSRLSTGRILKDMGLPINVDRRDHITLGRSESGMTPTEMRHVEHIIGDALLGLEVWLEPVAIEHDGRRISLSDAKHFRY